VISFPLSRNTTVFEEIYLPVLPSTALVLAREQMRGRPDIGIVAGTDSKRYCTYIQLTSKGSIDPAERRNTLSVYIDFG
jgi:hypothetical protein